MKLLDFIVDQKLTRGEHVQEVAMRLPRVLLLLRKLKNYVTSKYLAVMKSSWLVAGPSYYSLEEWFYDDLRVLVEV